MTRVLSAVVLSAILLVTIWWLPWTATLALAAVAAGLAGFEVAGLATSAGAPTPRGPIAVASAMMAVAFAAVHADALVPMLLAIVVGSGLLALASGPPSPAALTRAATMMMAPFYTGLPLGALAGLAVTGPEPLTWLIVVIAASDSAQYYTGRAFGRRKLAPAVSPAKTVEGAIGGIVMAGVAAVVAGMYWMPAQSLPALAVLGVLLAAFGMAGDLFESLLKRSAGVKDSSTLIPGHGGVLDRLDSYLFAAPAFYVFSRYFA
jgi:phosphatidate cytidylyltransferase